MTITRRKLLAGALAAPVAVSGVAAAAAGAATRLDPAPVDTDTNQLMPEWQYKATWDYPPRWEVLSDQLVISVFNEIIGGFEVHHGAVRASGVLLLPMHALYRLNRPMYAGVHQTVLQHIMANNPYTAATGRPITIKLQRA